MLAVTLMLAALLGQAPYEAVEWATPATEIDALVLASLEAKGIVPARPCSDEVFVRRVFLDAIGTLPEPREVTAFLEDTRPDKRAALTETLLQRDEFGDYWALKWGDALRIKSEFPINLWPNAAQAYHRWVRAAIRDNMPYDDFVRALLTSSGSNFRVPPVNFYRALQGRDPSAIAEATALTFMGVHLEKWPQARQDEMAVFFSRLIYKKTDEWKEEIVCLDPAPLGELKAVLPDGVAVTIGADQDPRAIFADWLTAPGNPWLARNVANRVWAWLLGRGIVHEPEDFREDNPPSNPELLAYLEKEVAGAKYDLRHLYRLILNSRTYQQSSIPQDERPEAEALFAYYPTRRLDAEVLLDALNRISGQGEKYTSAVPEPYTNIPAYRRTIALEDGSVTSSFLEMFGRPTRDAGLFSERNNQPSDAQRLHLLNSSEVKNKVAGSPRLRSLITSQRNNPQAVIGSIYLGILSRRPTATELETALGYLNDPESSIQSAAQDLAWALVNSKEFLYRH